MGFCEVSGGTVAPDATDAACWVYDCAQRQLMLLDAPVTEGCGWWQLMLAISFGGFQ